MKRQKYIKGEKGKKHGIFNTCTKSFQFGISEDSPMLAEARLFYRIGEDARKYRFVVKELPNN